ncbi:LisM domain containing protein [Bacillus tianshenii]|nr:LisM domain containing protein [Bacillus tianshenii]
MKKVLLSLLATFILYAAYSDLTTGSLRDTTPVYAKKQEQRISAPYVEHKVQPGDTLLSITQTLHGGKTPVLIDQLIKDFKKYNKNTEPINIQTDKVYRFPTYSLEKKQ